MRLLLIRHGETVDNVAQLYAGVRDSALTNHGVQQAHRLGNYLFTTSPRFTHIFSSDLQRAFKTAEAIRLAQDSQNPPTNAPLKTMQLPILREQDFGFYEGKSFLTRPRDSNKSGKEAHYEEHKNEPGFKDMESKESMAERMDGFLDQHLVPIMQMESATAENNVAVVSHGIILSVLWKRLLLRLAPNSVTLRPELVASNGGFVLEHLGGWSNTGYLELEMKKTVALPVQPYTPKFEYHPIPPRGDPLHVNSFTAALPEPGQEYTPGKDEDNKAILPEQVLENGDCGSPVPDPVTSVTTDVSFPNERQPPTVSGRSSTNTTNDSHLPLPAPSPPSLLKSPPTLADWTTTIRTINGREHLKGLKRTGGGVGSAQFDESQKTIDKFFKRRKGS